MPWHPCVVFEARDIPKSPGELPGIPQSPEPPLVDAPAPSKEIPQMPKVWGGRMDRWTFMDFMMLLWIDFCVGCVRCFALFGCFWFGKVWRYDKDRVGCRMSLPSPSTTRAPQIIWDIEDYRFRVWNHLRCLSLESWLHFPPLLQPGNGAMPWSSWSLCWNWGWGGDSELMWNIRVVFHELAVAADDDFGQI